MKILRLQETTSTLDVAHELAAEGAEAGTVVVAESQTAGRGRMGRTWRSEKGAGLWLTVIERPGDASGLYVLSLRVGLALAPVLDLFTEAPVRLKWPNDLYVNQKKLAGILIEARWREGMPDWVAIGVGINLRPPAAEPNAIGLGDRVDADEVLQRVTEAIHAAAQLHGPLSQDELAKYERRDLAKGRRAIEPVAGIVKGIDESGALVVDVASEEVQVRAGSLILEDG